MQGIESKIVWRAVGAAVSMALILCVTSIGLVLHAANLAAQARVDTAIQQVNDIAIQWISTRERLKLIDPQACDPQTLVSIRQETLLNPYLLEVVLLNEQGMYCSSIQGLLDPALPIPQAEYYDSDTGARINSSAAVPSLPTFKTWMTNFDSFAGYLDLRSVVAIDEQTELYHVDENGAFLAYAGGKRGLVNKFGTLGTGVRTQCLSIRYCITAKADFATSVRLYWWLFAVYFSAMIVVVAGVYMAALNLWRNYFSPVSRVLRGMQNRQGLYNVYQPIIELGTGEVIGCEVLSRFEDEFGRLRPDEFIPLIPQQKTWLFTEHVMQRAFDDLAGVACPSISINVYPHDLEDLQKLQSSRGLKNAKHTPFKLCLEVLETEIRNMNALVHSTKWLRSQGFSISIDDFGTGYSNLQSLNQLAFDYLKVDRSFTTEIESAAIKSSMWPNLVALAEALKVVIIAEGVENQSQSRILNHLGVRYCQGYFFAAPMKADAFKAFLLDPHLCQS
ncbi:EAL domain-containing protein [Salinibius halmophilus]|uniref:EAL domain-containing protein n=1 Tax=Salinibius halmophilus TaxID=1853216 RepID=UPI001314D4AE|nr:EAL domain-containing protein [Salinibius halmophilus]